ncbi:MAG: hypothetical protein ACLFRV_05280 [Acidimicrobiales bacterium]
MITLGAKLYFGLTAAALVAAFVLGLASGGTPLGVISFAWSGPVGDQFGYTVLVGLAAISFFLAIVIVAFRDADAEAVAEVAGTDTLPEVVPPAHLSPWPIVAAFGVATLLVGLVVDLVLAGIGIVLLAAAAVEWTVGAWSDRATGDPDANRALRNRLMAPIETPAASVFGVFLFVFFASRLLLAVSKWGAIGIFGASAVVILAVAAFVATRPSLDRSLVTGALLVGGLLLIGGGIAGLAAGEREFHDLGSEGENGHVETDDTETDDTEGDAEGDATDDDTTAGDTEE